MIFRILREKETREERMSIDEEQEQRTEGETKKNRRGKRGGKQLEERNKKYIICYFLVQVLKLFVHTSLLF